MDELYAFLFAGLFILLMLFVFFGGPRIEPYTPLENGSTGEFNWKIIELGDVALEEQKVEKKEILDGLFKIRNGIFSGKPPYKRRFEVEKYILENLDNATLSFTVKDTNNYGKLYVILNNETLVKKSAPLGKYTLNMAPIEENYLEFKAGSSGWKIWAPTVYIISNLSIETDYSFKEIPRYEFFISEYIYKNFYECKLQFDFIESNEKFNISLNNQTEYNGIPDSRVNVIKLKNIKEGKNLISFSSDGKVKLENAKLKLFYYK